MGFYRLTRVRRLPPEHDEMETIQEFLGLPKQGSWVTLTAQSRILSLLAARLLNLLWAHVLDAAPLITCSINCSPLDDTMEREANKDRSA
jgi:hypothetical protein